MCRHCFNRREFGLVAAGAAGGMLALPLVSLAEGQSDTWSPDKPPVVTGRPLRVQPVLMYARYAPREKTSWRSWSSVINDAAANEEIARIQRELDLLKKKAEFPMEILPLAKVTSAEAGSQVQQGAFDVVLLYAASGGMDLFRAASAKAPERDTVVFVRHRSGPTYYWYECFGTRAAPARSPENGQKNTVRSHGGLTLDDCVVDDYDEVLWRFRALYGLKNFVGRRIVTLGGPGGKWDGKAPTVAREKYLLDIVPVGYDDLEAQLKTLLADAKVLALAQKCADRYLALPGTVLETKKEYVRNAFVLYFIFKEWLRKHEAPALTINSCMSTIMPMADTTACLTLSLLNDEGYPAFCESDFVIIPAGILLHYIAGKPVFLHNSTFPHRAMVTCAHCTRAAAHGRQALRAGSSDDALRVGLRGGAEGRDPRGPASDVHRPRVHDRPMGGHEGHRPRQSHAAHLPQSAGRRDPGRLEETAGRSPGLPLDDGLRRLLAGNRLCRLEDRRAVG